NGFSGDLIITDNEIDGYNSTPGRAAVMTRSGAPASDVSIVDFSNNAIINPTAGSLAVLIHDGMGVLDARGNWWGSESPDFSTLVNVANVEDPDDFTVLADDWLTEWGAADTDGPGLADTGATVEPITIGIGAL